MNVLLNGCTEEIFCSLFLVYENFFLLFLETPYIPKEDGGKGRDLCPYKVEIDMIKSGEMLKDLYDCIRNLK